MRTLGYALILFGIISAVIILIYGNLIGWSGLTGSIAAVLAGIGFLTVVDCYGCCKESAYGCGCNRC